MKEFFAAVGVIIASIIILAIIVIGFSWGNIAWLNYFGVKTANAQREVTLHSRPFTAGMKQDLLKYMGDWNKAKTDVDKSAIEYTVQQMFAEYDENILDNGPAKEFLMRCKYHTGEYNSLTN